MNRIEPILKDTFRNFMKILATAVCLTVVNIAVFRLYKLDLEPFIYVTMIEAFILLAVYVIMAVVNISKTEARRTVMSGPKESWNELEPSNDLCCSDLQKMISDLVSELKEKDEEFFIERRDMVDYYTAWVHQIKTPISVMRLELKDKDTEEGRILMNELCRIEDYVDMVLQYIRLESDSTDLVIKEYSLDELLRESFRKYASQFIARGLSLEYEEADLRFKTDKKWFSVIIGQLISNAVKYTPEGKVRVYVNENKELVIEDTGIGIEAEDIPRIFDKGYTGNNGRLGMNSSGLGLYLCKRAADLISVKLRVLSQPDKGSSFILSLPSEDLLLD